MDGISKKNIQSRWRKFWSIFVKETVCTHFKLITLLGKVKNESCQLITKCQEMLFPMLSISLTGKISKSDEIWLIMMTPCCAEECFKKLRYVDIKHSRDSFLSLENITEERNFILNYLKVHMASGEVELLEDNLVFMIKGISVCKDAWLLTHGISVRRMLTIFKEYSNKGVQVYQHGNKRRKRSSPKTCECLAWLNFLVNSIGDHQPDSGLIHLPVLQN